MKCEFHSHPCSGIFRMGEVFGLDDTDQKLISIIPYTFTGITNSLKNEYNIFTGF